jgi:hypothetical protein
MTLFTSAQVVGTFLGFSQGGLEFHADLVLPYHNDFQKSAMHGQFVLVALENDNEAILGRITTISSQGRLVSPSGEDYAIRAVREDRPIPEDLRDQYLKYRVDIRILGVLRAQEGEKPPIFIASHRRLPHVGAKVAFLSDELLREVSNGNADGETVADIGFLALGEFVYSGTDRRAGDDERIVPMTPTVVARFDVEQLVSRRSFVFARAGFGKSNLIKLLFADLYGLTTEPSVEKRGNRRVPVGTVIFDPDGEYYWPDDKGRPGLCDVEALQDRLVVFTDRQGPSPFYDSFVVDQVRLDIRELSAAKVIGLVISADRQDQRNVERLRSLPGNKWKTLVDAVWADRGSTDLDLFYDLLELKPDREEAVAIAARGNMVRAVTSLHDPSSQLLRALKQALSDGKLCVVDISRMRGAQGLALAGVLLQHIFEHNQEEFTKAVSGTIPTIAVVEEAQSVLGSSVSHAEGPFVDWVKEGRKYDLGAVLVTQQPRSLPDEILSQGDNWFIFHLLAAGDLRAAKNANAHFSDDLLATLLNEPLPGHGVFWSSAGARPYPIPIRTLLFENTYSAADPDYSRPRIDCYAAQLRGSFRRALEEAVAAVGAVPAGGDAVDATETITRAAVEQLRNDPDFQARIRTPEGVRFAEVQTLLADALPSGFATNARQWVFDQNLVWKALDEILGQDGHTKARRPKVGDATQSVTWLLATPQARPAPGASAAQAPPVNQTEQFDLDEPL